MKSVFFLSLLYVSGFSLAECEQAKPVSAKEGVLA